MELKRIPEAVSATYLEHVDASGTVPAQSGRCAFCTWASAALYITNTNI